MTTTIKTGPSDQPEALVAELYTVVPVKSAGPGKGQNAVGVKREPPTVPSAAVLFAGHSLTSRSGVDYAHLTGDYNPIHVSAVLARASGFASVILHGFGQLALVFEDLVRTECSGDPAALAMLDVRFLGNVVMPCSVCVSVDRALGQVAEGGRAGERATMLGSFRSSAAPLS